MSGRAVWFVVPSLLATTAIAAVAGGCGGGNIKAVCTVDTDCGQGMTCQTGVCKTKAGASSCTRQSDCATGTECIGGECKPKSASCHADTDCASGMRCDTARNACVSNAGGDGGVPDTGASEMGPIECLNDLACSSPAPSCVNGHCLSCAQTGCTSPLSCDAVSGLCTRNAPDGGAPDTGTPDGGGGGVTDIGTPDAGTDDAGVEDAGAEDTGGQDSPDSGEPDAGEADAGETDAGTGCEPTSCPCDSYCDMGSGICLTGCANVGDCCSGKKCLNGACITPECLADTDCTTAPNNRCEKSIYTCVQCTADYHCPGSTCDFSNNTCFPKERGDIGAPCTVDDDCPIDGLCIPATDAGGNATPYAGGYCSADCTSLGYCDSYSGTCVTVSPSPLKKECLLECYGDTDCRLQYICASTGGYSGVCTPRCDNPGVLCDTGYVCNSKTGLCDGSQDLGDPCGGTFNQCKTGLYCAGYPGTQYHCFKTCDPSSDPFCSGGEVCTMVDTTGICFTGGTVGAGGDCSTADCINGYICGGDETTGLKCYKGCDKDDNNPGCPFGERCNLLTGETRLGICRRGT